MYVISVIKTPILMQHIFLNCEISKQLWLEVNDWIIELGMLDYNVSNIRIIVW